MGSKNLATAVQRPLTLRAALMQPIKLTILAPSKVDDVLSHLGGLDRPIASSLFRGHHLAIVVNTIRGEV